VPARGLPQAILGLIVDAEDALQELNRARVHGIDATMPPEADFVNYELDESQKLVIREICGDYGLELPKVGYEHIGKLLTLLGEPDVEFDGDLVMNSLDVPGWEREDEHDPQRASEARLQSAIAYEKWERAVKARNDMVTESIRNHGSDVEAFDFDWNASRGSLGLAGVIPEDGRVNYLDRVCPEFG